MQLHKTVYLSTIVEEIFNVMKFHPKEYTFSSHIDELYCLHIIHMVWMFVLVLVELNVRKRNDNNNSNYVQILNQQGFARVRTIGRLGRMQIILLQNSALTYRQVDLRCQPSTPSLTPLPRLWLVCHLSTPLPLFQNLYAITVNNPFDLYNVWFLDF